jgi:ABC-2 type transport system permease protein
MITTAPPGPTSTIEERPVRATAPAPIPLSRIAMVELRKSVDTRAGFWLLASIGIGSLLATIAVILFATADQFTHTTFTTAILFPMSVILPIIAILSVTAEWSQRTGLTTFTLVPHRGRVLVGKAIAVAAIGVVSTVLAFGVGALGNVVGTAIADTQTVWDLDATALAYLVLANTLLLAVGFMLGVLIRNTPGAIVAYFVYSFVVPPALTLLAFSQTWFRDLRPWVDFNVSQNALLQAGFTGEQWAQLSVTAIVWLMVPLAVGVRTATRAEVK